MFKPTLSGKIAALVAVFIIITVSIGTGMFLYRLDRITEENIQRKISVITNTLMPSLTENILKNELSTIQTVVELLVQSDMDIPLFIISDDENKILASVRAIDDGRERPLGTYRKFLSRITIPGSNADLGSVQIFYNLDSFITNRDRLKKEMVGMALVLVFLAIAISALLSKRLTVQLEKLTQASLKVSEGDLNQTVEPKTRDEIGTLGTVFNQMVADIRKSHENLKRANDELSAIYEVGRIINSSDSIEDVFSLSREVLQSGFAARSGAVYHKSGNSFVKKTGFEVAGRVLPETIAVHELTAKGLAHDSVFASELGDAPVAGLELHPDDILVPMPAGDKLGGIIILNDYDRDKNRETLMKMLNILGSLLGPAVVTAGSLESEKNIRQDPFRLLVEVLKGDFDKAAELDYPLSLIRLVVQGTVITGEEMHKLRDQVMEKIKGVTNVLGVYPGEILAVVPGKGKTDIRRNLLGVELDRTVNQNPIKTQFVAFPEDGKDVYQILFRLRG